jgi:hypothetical protein
MIDYVDPLSYVLNGINITLMFSSVFLDFIIQHSFNQYSHIKYSKQNPVRFKVLTGFLLDTIYIISTYNIP